MVGVDNKGAPVLCAEPPIISGCCACVTLFPLLAEALEDNRGHPVAGDRLLIVVRSAGALTGTRHDPSAAPPVVSGTTLPATGGRITFGVPTDLAEQIPGVPTDGIEGTVPIDVAELCRWIPGVAPPEMWEEPWLACLGSV